MILLQNKALGTPNSDAKSGLYVSLCQVFANHAKEVSVFVIILAFIKLAFQLLCRKFGYDRLYLDLLYVIQIATVKHTAAKILCLIQ